MGMFDEIRCRRVMPDGYRTDELYQTKDLDCVSALYEITDDGRLIQLRSSWHETHETGVDMNFDGRLNFYDLTNDGAWHDYHARFVDGTLVEITMADHGWRGYLCVPRSASEDAALHLSRPDWLDLFDHEELQSWEFNVLEQAGVWDGLLRSSGARTGFFEEAWIAPEALDGALASLSDLRLEAGAAAALEKIRRQLRLARERAVPLILAF